MREALRLAERGRLRAHPNPLVGCVIVRGGRVVGRGAHEVFGGPHAETVALADAGALARGATMYVTLEPCRHWGKTPPCAEAVLRAGVRRVVAALEDPDKRNAGRGLDLLRKGGVAVKVGVLRGEAEIQNRAFLKHRRTGLPYVLWKSAQTLDGKIASRTGVSKWITGASARSLGHVLRAQSDAVMVGAETVRRDDPALTAHGAGPDPLRIVVSSSLRLPPSSNIFRGTPAWVVSARESSTLSKKGVTGIVVPRRGDGLDLPAAFRRLGEAGITRILLEGGGTLAAACLEAGLIDEAYLFVAPRFLGGTGARPSLGGRGWASPADGPALRDVSVRPVGDDILIHGMVR